MSKGKSVPAQKMVARFDWSKVEDELVTKLLLASGYDKSVLKMISAAGQQRQAERVFMSTAPLSRFNRTHLEVLRDQWLMRASAADLRAVVAYLALTVHTVQIDIPTASVATMRSYLKARKFTATFQMAVHRQFRSAHKVKQPVKRTSATTKKPPAPGTSTWRGQARELEHQPYPHQEEALRLLAAHADQPHGGLLVLPTGGGKTRTAAMWAIQRLTSHPGTRVLWLAHQQELLQQARDEFARLALTMPPERTVKAQLIASGHSGTSALIDEDLDIVFSTWQSLHRNWTSTGSRRVKTFLKRPTIVIVDEAHRAGAAGYDAILTAVGQAGASSLLGLTATPWPTGFGAGKFQKTFPTEVYRIAPEKLHAQGILATPVFHTIDTGITLHPSGKEANLVGGDLAGHLLRRVATEERDRITVRHWISRPEFWGKTLAFTTSKAHADQLTGLFKKVGVDVEALYSGAPRPRGEILQWFRDHPGPCVLVSVGMLTEGVDLPDARTAVLARPTASRILLRQMIGRVLRGTKAGGEATAHLLYLRDHWVNFEEVLHPEDLPDLAGRRVIANEAGLERPLPPLVDETTHVPVPADLERQLIRMFRHRVRALPHENAASSSHLVGYYDLGDVMKIPVLAHQVPGFQDVVSNASNPTYSFQGRPPATSFDDVPPPYPTNHMLSSLVDFVRYMGPPPLVPVAVQGSAEHVAQRLHDQPKLDQGVWMQQLYEATLSRLAYRSVDHFRDDVYRLLAQSRRTSPRTGNRESAMPLPDAPPPVVYESHGRQLPSIKDVARKARRHLAGEQILESLVLDALPPCRWTNKPNAGFWATWTLKTTGRNAGTVAIRVNRALRVSCSHVSDEMLEYLLFHELLHHLLPGHGHSAEFHRLEALWPESDQLDLEFDTLHERLPVKAQQS